MLKFKISGFLFFYLVFVSIMSQTSGIFQIVYKHEIMGRVGTYNYKCSDKLDIPSSDTLVKNTSDLEYYPLTKSDYKCRHSCYDCIIEVTPKPDGEGKINGLFYYIKRRDVGCPPLSGPDNCRDSIILVQGYLKDGKRHGFVMQHYFAPYPFCNSDDYPCATSLYLYENGVKKENNLKFKTGLHEGNNYKAFQYFFPDSNSIEVKEFNEEYYQINMSVD